MFSGKGGYYYWWSYRSISGIGYQTALELASRGCRVIIADVVNTKKSVEQIIKQTKNPNIVGKNLDLASLQSVRDLVKDIYENEVRLDILINNAGTGNINISYTDDGLEGTMQINYFGHFLLTHLLLDLLKKSAPSRIIFSSSILAYVSDLTLEHLNPKEEYKSVWHTVIAGGTYGASKLCIAMASKLFANKLYGSGVTSNTYHPGATRTYIFFKDLATKTWKDFLRTAIGCLAWTYGKSAEEGAQTLIYLAHADEVKNITGKFFMEGRVVWHPYQLKNKKFCEEVWERSIIYTKLEPNEVKC
ncbi:unnamed protein product [Ceutorhynchus assimilis]|uniref:Uncharacterized protein n=1 Tax=Ceutorhynchus assimilis TaxID=467358 RepID=A0A9P0GPZ8_9CUCU|nr:unnamed protein product [Ceutorhynchus assimilis]